MFSLCIDIKWSSWLSVSLSILFNFALSWMFIFFYLLSHYYKRTYCTLLNKIIMRCPIFHKAGEVQSQICTVQVGFPQCNHPCIRESGIQVRVILGNSIFFHVKIRFSQLKSNIYISGQQKHVAVLVKLVGRSTCRCL